MVGGWYIWRGIASIEAHEVRTDMTFSNTHLSIAFTNLSERSTSLVLRILSMACRISYILTKETAMVKGKKKITAIKALMTTLQKKIINFLRVEILLQTTVAIPLFLI